MLTRYAIVGKTYSASHNQCSIATGTEHIKFIKLYKTLTTKQIVAIQKENVIWSNGCVRKNYDISISC